jgi:hypothetical protein
VAALDKTVAITDTLLTPSTADFSLETGVSLLSRLGSARVITDDNMATEWQELR